MTSAAMLAEEIDADALRRDYLQVVVRSVRGTLPSNLVTIPVSLLLLAQLIPLWEAVAVIGVRALAMLMSVSAVEWLGKCLANDRPYRRAAMLFSVMMTLSGVAYGIVIASVPFFPPTIEGVMVVGLVLVAAFIVTFLMAPLRPAAVLFQLGLGVTIYVSVLLDTPGAAIGEGLVILVMALGVLTFAFKAGDEHVAAARLRATNARLTAALEDALADARGLAMTDQLTGVGNRRAFAEHAAVLSRSEGKRTDLILIDLDHFKRINDRHGHSAGDEVLMKVGYILRGVVETLGGPPIMAARLGGEEFVVLLPDDCGRRPQSVAEDVRSAIAGIRIGSAPNLRPSASIGVARWNEGPVETALRDADVALYRAKDSGRNRVALAA